MKKTLIKVLKVIYIKIPLKLSTKQKIKKSLEKRFRLIRNVSNYNEQLLISQKFVNGEEIKFEEVVNQSRVDKKIAVHLHLYYTDLSDEFISYLNNIPYEFDLLLSVKENENLLNIEDKFKRIRNVNRVIVKEVKNVGRDFSPMFITFKNQILKYDYLLHVHTKKSIRTGIEQDGWRNHMLNSVMGSKEIVEKIFSKLENDNIGLIYPETYYDMPYWAHTFLKNRENCDKIAKQLGIKIENSYIDYSVGSFFWVRVSAIDKFLKLNYSWDDFGKEEGKADGTLAHAIERMIRPAVTSSGYKYLVIDCNSRVFRTKGKKNLYQYNNQSLEQCKKELSKYDIISFDIFDTLITRKAYNPLTLFEILEKYVKDEFDIDDFKKIRQDCEYNVRVDKKFVGDCTIDEIYAKMVSDGILNINQVEKVKNKEIELELSYCIPRNDLLNIFNYLKDNSKEIVLISDMYLTSETIEKMLKKCGYSGWSKLLISSETGLRKDNGTIWEYYYTNIVREKSSIHVGDNEQSDIQQLCDMAKPFYHVMQGKMMYSLTNYHDYINNNIHDLKISDQVALGLIINKMLYNSPFRNHSNQFVINSFEEFGYSFIAPIIMNFLIFLEKNIEKKKYNRLLFLAREGYYLQKLYGDFCNNLGIKKIDNVYFLTSRRSTSVSCIKNIDDAYEIISKDYEGRITSLFENRLGIKIDVTDDFIKVNEEGSRVRELLEKVYDENISNFNDEANNYKKYCSKYIGNKDKVAVVDLGYSGTIQYYLMKLMDKKIDGYYFTLSDNVKPEKIGGKCYGCFNGKADNDEKNIYLFSMILETFLTAPYGQLIKFDTNLNPIYRNENTNDELLKKLDEIYFGVKKFFKDYIETIGKNLDDLEMSNSFVSVNFSSLVYSNSLINDELKKIFIMDNSYSLDSKINVFDYLDMVYKNKSK